MLTAIAYSCLMSIPLAPPVVSSHLAPPSFSPIAIHYPITACSTNQSVSLPADPEKDAPSPADPPVVAPAILPVTRPSHHNGIAWTKLAKDSMRFLAIMHAFRWSTEPGTRSGGVGLGNGYTRSVENLHGWSDGDPFYVNYVGHPMQGAVAGRLFLLNSPRYNRTEFGRSRDYWKGKLSATAFAWAFSEQFEIGPVSEASIGHIQKDYPQHGFVDHVITPAFGFGWMVGEDAIDRFMIRRLEDRTANRWLRIALRTGLNPARTFANVIDGRAPWDRGSRAGIMTYRGESYRSYDPRPSIRSSGEQKPAPFEFSFTPGYRQFGRTSCIGGGGEGAFRVADDLQLVLSVNGCKLRNLPTDFSGDALVYQIGPRWTPAPTGKWSPYAHFLVGGIKATQEQIFSDKESVVDAANRSLDPSLTYTLHDQYTAHGESSGLAITAGTGIDYKLNDALAIRVLAVDYLHSTAQPVNGTPFNNGFQVSTGMVLRIGTW